MNTNTKRYTAQELAQAAAELATNAMKTYEAGFENIQEIIDSLDAEDLADLHDSVITQTNTLCAMSHALSQAARAVAAADRTKHIIETR